MTEKDSTQVESLVDTLKRCKSPIYYSISPFLPDGEIFYKYELSDQDLDLFVVSPETFNVFSYMVQLAGFTIEKYDWQEGLKKRFLSQSRERLGVTETYVLLQQLDFGRLPEDVKVLYVKIKRDAYGDIQIIYPDWMQDSQHELPPDIPVSTMKLTLKSHQVNGKEVWADCKELDNRKILLIGKFED